MASSPNTCTDSIPASAGIGLRSDHYKDLTQQLPETGWLEGHSENYFSDGGQALHFLEQLRNHYPLSLHGVGLGIGSTDPFDQQHLKKLKKLIQRFEPGLVSEHLCWNSYAGAYMNDLLPLPYTAEALNHVVNRIDFVQNHLGRKILIENLSSYLQFHASEMPEWDFLSATAERSGCGILLDINNIYVNSCNHSFDPKMYLEAIPAALIGEIHLAGFEQRDGIKVDTHSRPVSDPVWELYAFALNIYGSKPTLIEWDNDIPPLQTLLAEANKAQTLLNNKANHEAVA